MDRQYTDQTILLSAAAGNGASAAANFASFRNVELQISMAAYTGTIKIVGSNADAPPDFSSAATGANPWDYVKCINQIDGSAVNGGTGLTGAATTSVTNLAVNSDGMKWIGVITSGAGGGSVTAKVKGYSNV